MNWSIILANLREAHGDMRHLEARLAYLDTGKAPEGWEEIVEHDAQKGLLATGVIAAQFEHVYHHLNWAWNCRNADEERAIRCESRDFRRWEKFPRTWPELRMAPCECKRKISKWRSPDFGWRTIRPMMMRLAIREAEYTLRRLIEDIEGKAATSKNDFADLMRHIFMKMNEAWNTRKVRAVKSLSLSKTNIRRMYCFPREFPRLRPQPKAREECRMQN